ncbi:hypothetical protein [Parageobacillus toebii]|uniref:hypothetical protein n=1 Tax=Parageobacillus toebii TaxID=153151 RepID=UPI0035B52071
MRTHGPRLWGKKSVEVKIKHKYSGDSQRADSFEIKYKIGRGRWIRVDFENVSGGKSGG